VRVSAALRRLQHSSAIVSARSQLWREYHIPAEHGAATAFAALSSGAYQPTRGRRTRRRRRVRSKHRCSHARAGVTRRGRPFAGQTICPGIVTPQTATNGADFKPTGCSASAQGHKFLRRCLTCNRGGRTGVQTGRERQPPGKRDPRSCAGIRSLAPRHPVQSAAPDDRRLGAG
jgi:hypothetical protein